MKALVIGGSNGIGLAIVKHIAQLHNGKAELHSVPGLGCSFIIAIPQNIV